MYYDLLNAALVWAIFSYPCPDRLVQPIVSSQQSLSSALSSHGSGGWRTAVVRPGGFCATPLKGMNRSVDRGECEPTEQLNFLGPGGGGGYCALVCPVCVFLVSSSGRVHLFRACLQSGFMIQS